MRSPLVVAAPFVLVASMLLTGCASTVRGFIYWPEPLGAAPQWAGDTPESLAVETRDGLSLTGYVWPGPVDRGVILFLPGNAGNRDTAAEMAEPLAGDGYGLVVASWRGFGDNPGQPTEAGLIADSEAFLAATRRRFPGQPIHLFGFSLGGGVALHLAARQPVDGVFTLGAFSSLAAVAPTGTAGLLPDKFDNIRVLPEVTAPILLLHGTADETIPFSEATKLHTAARGKARLHRLEGADHYPDFARLRPIVRDQISQMRNAP